MNNSILLIPVINLVLSFIPVIVVVAILYRWSLNYRTALYAVTRMLVQLLLIGYALVYIFDIDHAGIIFIVLTVMLTAASLISFRSVQHKSASTYIALLLSISIGGLTTLFFVTGVVLELDPWYMPQYLVPLAGMIIANCMNCVSLAAERFDSEIQNRSSYIDARRTALKASLIPVTNTLFAVGLVSLPGMMSGQILSGIDPLIAVRYQIMVMCMIFGSAGITSACYLMIIKNRYIDSDT